MVTITGYKVEVQTFGKNLGSRTFDVKDREEAASLALFLRGISKGVENVYVHIHVDHDFIVVNSDTLDSLTNELTQDE
jgi:hypothetical protein